jgi:uncharacterized membrane protein
MSLSFLAVADTLPEASSITQVTVRWLHVIAGVTWIGHLYFFNFVNVPLQGKLDKDTKKVVNPQLMPRALWWFRWGAMITFLAGLVLLYMMYGLPTRTDSKLWFDADGKFSGRAMWITLGALLGIIMFLNVWLVIWPAQKKLIAWTRDGQAPPEMPPLAARAKLASRINTFLSGPMLFCMVLAPHLSSMNWQTLLLAVVLGVGVIWLAINGSAKAGASI